MELVEAMLGVSDGTAASDDYIEGQERRVLGSAGGNFVEVYLHSYRSQAWHC